MTVFHGFGPGQSGLINYVPTTDHWFRPQGNMPAYKSTDLDKMPEEHFSDLAKKVAAEVARRQTQVQLTKLQKQMGYVGLSNFMLGVAHAMACRAALRFAAGHEPYGPGLTQGAPWNVVDGAKVGQYVNKWWRDVSVNGASPNRNSKWARSVLNSNPLLWTTAGDIKYHLGLNKLFGGW
jgi:hypothetical protein